MLSRVNLKKRYTIFILSLLLIHASNGFSQAFNQSTVAVSANMGVPHLYKGILRLSTESDKFKKVFNGKLEVSGFKGLYPVALKGEWGINKYFGIGLSGSMWNLSFQVKDYYNVMHAGQVTGTDEIDILNLNLPVLLLA